MPISVLLGLVTCNLIWSANPVAGKFLLADFSPAEAAWLRYASALCAYVAGSLFFLRKKPFLRPRRKSAWVGMALLGFLTFCFSPLLQMNGLRASGASVNALIVAMEPLMAIFLAWLFLRERLSGRIKFVLALAVTGFALLSGLTPGALDKDAGGATYSLGTFLILASLIGEASFSVLGKKLIRAHAPQPLFGTVLVLGVAFLTLAVGVSEGLSPLGIPARIFVRFIDGFRWESAMALLWLGPLGTAFTYLYWMKALERASVASVAVTLFVQPVFGAMLGILLLGESLSPAQGVGAALILLAVSLQAIVADGGSSCERPNGAMR